LATNATGIVALDMKAIVLTLVIGLVLYLLAVRIYNDWLFLRRPRLTALGTVIGHRRISSEGGQSFFLIIRFDSDDGRTIEFTNSWAFWLQLPVGSLVAVEYPAGFPQKARIPKSYSPLLTYGLAVVVLALLSVFAVTPGQ
jgi:hypothetical protein